MRHKVRKQRTFPPDFKTMSLIAFLVIVISASCGGQKGTGSTSDQSSELIHFLIPFDSIGVETGDSTLMLGSIGGTAITPDGRIAILDRTLGGVRFYSEQGEYLTSFIPRGDGAGEFLSVDRMVFDGQGNMCLASRADKKTCVFDSDLNLVRELVFTSPDRGGVASENLSTDNALVMNMMVMLGEDSVATEIALFSDSIQPDFIYRRRVALLCPGLNARESTRMDFAVASNGRVYISNYSFEEYEIACYSKEGDSLFTFGVPGYEPVAKSDSVLAILRQDALEQYFSYYGTEEGFTFEPELYWHPVTSIQIDWKDRIWITGEQYIDRARIFDAKGNLLYNARLVAPDWQDCDAWNIRVSPNGVLADPMNPELHPVVYILREETRV